MVSSDLRRDPITGRSVVIDREPFRRRDDFVLEPVKPEGAGDSCVLCDGHEAEAGHEVLAWRDGRAANQPGWSVRVVPNRHPMLRIEGGLEVRADGLFETRDGLGAHEVVAETPVHGRPMQALAPEAIWKVLWAWRTRIHDLARDTRFAAITIVKNHGRAAGARLDHAHSQLMAFPMVPPVLAEKVAAGARHVEATGRCLCCDVRAGELADGRRVIDAGDEVVAFAPFASRVPFETWLMPRAHAPRFEEASDATLEALAAGLHRVLAGIDWALERPAYHLVLHSAPLTGEADRTLDWHLEILPRVTRYGGVEWGTGVHRNPVAPEEAAAALGRFLASR